MNPLTLSVTLDAVGDDAINTVGVFWLAASTWTKLEVSNTDGNKNRSART